MEIITNVELNKQDVVTVAMAKIEMHIRKKVREAKSRIKELDEERAKALNEIYVICKSSIPKPMEIKRQKIENAFNQAGLKDCSVRVDAECDSARQTNKYTLSVIKEKNNNFSRQLMYIDTLDADYTKTQKDLIEKRKKMMETKEVIADDAVKWKAKLSDMAAVERQMRAKVVESELSKTKDGKALVAILTKNYEETIDLLEM